MDWTKDRERQLVKDRAREVYKRRMEDRAKRATRRGSRDVRVCACGVYLPRSAASCWSCGKVHG